MSRQQLKNICIKLPATIPTTIPIPRPRTRPRSKPRPIWLLETLPNVVGKLEKIEMEKSDQYQKMLGISSMIG